MLQKDVCKECICEYRTNLSGYDEVEMPWVDSDDKLWETGRVACPVLP